MSAANRKVNDIVQQRLLSRLGYRFQDQHLFDLALSHRSYSKNNNERLEFLGDSLLNAIIAEALFHRFPTAKEGQLSRLRSLLVKGETLAQIAREFELGECINLGEGEYKSGGFRRDPILADTVEALIGAVYLDSDFSTCRERVLSWFAKRLETTNLKATTGKDPKTELQELLQGCGQPLPVYEITASTGQAHAQIFTVSCRVGLLDAPVVAQGKSRRQAEKKAAALVLDQLRTRQFQNSQFKDESS